MRDCKDKKDAEVKCARLLPYLPHYPDENTEYMESWEIVEVREATPQVLAP